MVIDKKTFLETKEKLESIKRSIPYLEKAIKSKSKKQIENSVGFLSWNLLRLYKNATDKGTTEAIQDLMNKLWWFRNQKNEEKREYRTAKQQYSQWAKKYDETNNLLIVLEEKEIKDFIDFKNLKNKNILDFGCGTGRYSIPFAKRGANVMAIDLTPAMIRRAKEKAKQEKVLEKIKFKQSDLLKYVPEKKFDLIISMLVQDHIKNLTKSVEVIDKASKIGTEIIISNVHPEALRKDVDKKTGQAQGYLVEGYKTEQYWHSIGEYIKLFREKGFFLTQIKDLIVEEKYTKMEKYKSFRGIKDKAIGIIMRFEKIK